MAFPSLSLQKILAQYQSLLSSLPPSLGLQSQVKGHIHYVPFDSFTLPMTPLITLFSIGLSCVSPTLDNLSFEVRGSLPVQVYVYNVIIILEEFLPEERMKERMHK